MQGFVDFADGVLGGLVLLALTVVAGGVPWAVLVLDARERRAAAAPGRRCLALVGAGAAALAVLQLAALTTKSLLLLRAAGTVTLGDLGGATWARAGLARAVVAIVVAAAAFAVRARRGSGGWPVLGVMVAALFASGAFLVHAVGRLDDRALLMTATVLHQAAAGIWVGGLVQLLAYAHLRRSNPDADARWPNVVARFSRVAIGSVAAVVATALPLGWTYVGSLGGLVGTAYGSLVVTKVALMGVALGIGAINFRAARSPDPGMVRSRVPHLVEAEALVLGLLVFAAATLAAQPPAVDVTTERATPAEVAEVFAPKWPRLWTPSLEDKRRDTSDPSAVVGGERSATAYQWSNFSHNVAGLVVGAMAILALVTGAGARWARHWPAGLVVLAVFVALRTSASDDTWPFGSQPFFGDAETLQHRLGAGLALAIGVTEWRARVRPQPGSILPYVFPLLAAAGGVLLLTHAHVAFELKSSYLIQVTHSTMGALAVLLACGRWLELRLGSEAGRAAGTLSHVAMLLIALVLAFYREANFVVPAD